MFDKPVDISKTYGTNKFKKEFNNPTSSKPRIVTHGKNKKTKKHQQKYAMKLTYQENLGNWYRQNF